MWGFFFAAITASPMVCESEGEVFLNRYHPQIILNNHLLSCNHLHGTRDYDLAPWDKPQQYVPVIEGSADSWMAYLKRILPPDDFDDWQADMTWRTECWSLLDDFVNPHRYGWKNPQRMRSLTKLKKLLGPKRFAAGWMPQPIPDYTDRIKWLQDLWTERTGFQGHKNALAGVSPLD